MKEPILKKIKNTFDTHGDERIDDYYWIKDKTNPEVISYLEEENKYYEEKMKPIEALTKSLYDDMLDRTPESESEVAIQHGEYFYYEREEKELEYTIYARKKAKNRSELDKAEEEIILDVNNLAIEGEYLDISVLKISTDSNYLAYLENRDGSDSYTLFIKNLKTGELLKDVIKNVYTEGSLQWSADGKYIFYITLNEMNRPYKLYRHEIGVINNSEDELLFEEKDERFSLSIYKSLSEKFIFLLSDSTNTTEISFIDSNKPSNNFELFTKRKEGVKYMIENHEDKFIVLTNENAINFKLLVSYVDDFTNLTELVPYDEKDFLQDIFPFKKAIYVTGRSNGITQIWKLEEKKLVPIKWDEDIYTVYIRQGQNYNTEEVLIKYQSLIEPETTYSININDESSKILYVAKVAGEYDKKNYIQERVWAKAPDGTEVPVLIFYKKDALKNGPDPLILQAYGSYGYSYDPFFDPYNLPLLDRGVILSVASVRGGSEFGRTWYFDGRLQNKKNTFTDYIAAANALIEKGFTSPNLLAGLGGSAGGLLIGAVANMTTNLFKVLAPLVPFVDVITTMLDETIPLTIGEWEEWGNPKNLEDYKYMLSYSPYDNVTSKEYPHMYVLAGLNDPRVGYFEPAKWTARLRELKTDTNTLLLKTNMGSGHGGPSGRLNEIRESAEIYSFILSKISN